LEPLAASGLRSIRYVKEIDGKSAAAGVGDAAVLMRDCRADIDKVVANDMSQSAVESIVRNRAFNGISEERLEASLDDGILLMMRHGLTRSEDHHLFHYDVVDLDPYGTAAPFLQAAMHAVCDNGTCDGKARNRISSCAAISPGLLCVTCTDSANLCGVNPDKGYANYGGVPLHKPYCHEMVCGVKAQFCWLMERVSRVCGCCYQRLIRRQTDSKSA
jgi:tRNA (guanine26-N2/guanine27-N2)-dimethyltransferase